MAGLRTRLRRRERGWVAWVLLAALALALVGIAKVLFSFMLLD